MLDKNFFVPGSVHHCGSIKEGTGTTDLPGLHLLSASSEGHIGVTSAGAIPFLLLDGGNERVCFTVFPLAAPVVKNFFDELVILLQQQFGLWKANQLVEHTHRTNT